MGCDRWREVQEGANSPFYKTDAEALARIEQLSADNSALQMELAETRKDLDRAIADIKRSCYTCKFAFRTDIKTTWGIYEGVSACWRSKTNSDTMRCDGFMNDTAWWEWRSVQA